jgi:signal recognition particle GTPase
LAKLYLQKDGGYTLRKFKRIYKREMEENPHKYLILNSKKGTTTIEMSKEFKEEEDESIETKSEE